MSIWNKLFSAGASNLVKDVGNVLDDVITSKEEKLAAELKIKELVARYEADIERNVTDRWTSDMASDSKLSKNVRPLMLIFLIVSTILMVFIDAGSLSFNVPQQYVDLLQIVLITTIGAYFGGRTIEKRNNNNN
ncbi:hypothetical protein [uncultured Mediterranean phage uvDeep-CGR2-KM19-C269]|nr:hypothetical protein [uncultured Mediterranean phage uvDeep-CGR2-KM19-C269]